MKQSDLAWIDGFARSVSDYVYVRERDSLLILLPNQAYKLNASGLLLLKQVLEGRPVMQVIDEFWPESAGSEQVLTDVHSFFCDLRALVCGCLGEGTGRRSVEQVPFERPYNLLPVLSEIALTYRCNLSCRFCYAGCRCSRKPRAPEMNTAQIVQILRIIRTEAEVPSVSWTGGEPALRDDLVELTGKAAETGLRVNLITNGTLIKPRLAADLRCAGLASAQVSIEGPDPSVHDALTQTPGSFERTIAGIRVLCNSGIHVHTNTTVNSVNAPHLAGIVRLASRLGMTRVSMNMVIPCGSAPGHDVTLTYTRTAELIEHARQAARQANIEFLWYSPTPYCIFNPIASGLGGKSCAACDGLLSVAPNGDVLPCSSLQRPVGNLLKQPFERVWFSRRASYWREKRYAHRICRGCDLFSLCSGACPIYWDRIGHAEIRNSRRRIQT